jgi:hypothetical protein
LWVGDYYRLLFIGAQAKHLAVTAVMMGGDGWDSSDLDLAASDGGFYPITILLKTSVNRTGLGSEYTEKLVVSGCFSNIGI